jgi:hypothetical protein
MFAQKAIGSNFVQHWPNYSSFILQENCDYDRILLGAEKKKEV